MRILATRPLATTSPLADQWRWRRMAPGLVVTMVVVGFVWVTAPESRGAAVLAFVLTLPLYAAAMLPWRRWPDSWQAVPALAAFASIAALDYAAGLFYLAILPIVWLALFFSRTVMLIAIGLFIVTLFVPRLIAPEAYPYPGMGTLILTAVLVVIGGLAGQGLISGARESVAEAKASARQARDDREMVDAYLDNAGALVLVLDPEGRFLLFNRFMEEATGVRTEDVVGQYTWDPNDAEDAARRSFERVLAGESPVVSEADMVTMTGETLRIVWNTTAVKDEAGKVIRVIAVGLDVTGQRAAEAAMREALERERQAAERLRELDTAKSDFVATVSHDLRTPLTSIIGNTEMLLDGDAGDLRGLHRRLLATIDRNARRLDTLVGDLLLLSRVESGTIRLNLRPVAVSELIDGAMEALAAKLSEDVTVAVDVPDEPVLVRGDREQLERVTINLVGNALKFTPPGGEVKVDVTVDPDRVQLRVCDTGIGIPEDELPHIFERFFRSSRSQQQARPGTGLGLTISKSIVELHDGSVEVAANPGGGTVFTVTLPRLAEPAEGQAGSARHAPDSVHAGEGSGP